MRHKDVSDFAFKEGLISSFSRKSSLDMLRAVFFLACIDLFVIFRKNK